MKESKYNFIKNIDGVNVFFNSKTCALAVVDDNFMNVLNDIKKNKFKEDNYDKKLIGDMKLSGCIIEDNVDEVRQIEFYRNMSKYDKSSLALTLAPTLACNFRCTYCFENHGNKVMNEKTQDEIISFIKSQIKNIKNLSITWYGGEPLIAKKIIYSLSEKILALCEENKVIYTSFIITNASLLTDQDILLFKKYKIRGAQVTIDGPKDVHDSRRISCDGKSTFDLLINNVNKLLNNGLDVIVRINVDKENISRIKELIFVLKDRIDKYSKLKIDFGKVSTFTEVCKSIEKSCFDNEEYADLLLPLTDNIINMGFDVNKMNIYPQVKYNYCCADYINSFVIDVDGFIYKCWNHVGVKEKSCGHISEMEKIASNEYLKWIQWNPLKNKKCKECKMLPICMGGCPDLVIDNKNDPVCDIVKYNLDNIIKFYYEKLKGVE